MDYKRLLSRGAIAAAALCAASAVQAQNVQQQGCQLSVFFPIGVASPNASQATAITQFVQGATTDLIAINGFASDIGSPAANQALSQSRASNVGAVVVSAGFQVAAQGFGESGPGPQFQRTDVVRDDCAEEVVQNSSANLGPGLLVAPAGVGALLLLLGDDSSSSGSTSTGTGSTFP